MRADCQTKTFFSQWIRFISFRLSLWRSKLDYLLLQHVSRRKRLIKCFSPHLFVITTCKNLPEEVNCSVKIIYCGGSSVQSKVGKTQNKTPTNFDTKIAEVIYMRVTPQRWWKFICESCLQTEGSPRKFWARKPHHNSLRCHLSYSNIRFSCIAVTNWIRICTQSAVVSTSLHQ